MPVPVRDSAIPVQIGDANYPGNYNNGKDQLRAAATFVAWLELTLCTVFVGIAFPLVSVAVGVWSSYRKKSTEDGGGKTGAGAASPTMDIGLADMPGFEDAAEQSLRSTLADAGVDSATIDQCAKCFESSGLTTASAPRMG